MADCRGKRAVFDCGTALRNTASYLQLPAGALVKWHTHTHRWLQKAGIEWATLSGIIAAAAAIACSDPIRNSPVHLIALPTRRVNKAKLLWIVYTE